MGDGESGFWRRYGDADSDGADIEGGQTFCIHLDTPAQSHDLSSEFGDGVRVVVTVSAVGEESDASL